MRVAVISLAFLSTMLLGEAVNPPTVVGKTVTTAWDAPTTNVDGTPYTDQGGYILAIAVENADLNGADEPLSTTPINDPAVTEIPFNTSVPDGRYSFWVCAVDRVGNRSVWAGPVITTVDAMGPNPPTNFTIRITLFELGGP